STGGSIDGMLTAADANLAATSEATIVIPGHGNPVSNRAELAAFREMLQEATPGESQANDIDFLMAVGELFALVVYAQLLLEAVAIDAVDEGLVDQIFGEALCGGEDQVAARQRLEVLA
ncbi:MAG: hypothetical protein ABGW82_09900, partial [Paracoccus sp. (in: a-proteobacteria)]